MRKAASSQDSVHYVSVSSAPGHTIRIVADVATKEGIQQITVTDHGKTGHITAMVAGRFAYTRGDASAMRVYWGFTQAEATKYAGQWIEVPSWHKAYPSVADDLTFPSFLSHLFPAQKNLSLVRAPMQGLVGVHGTVSGTGGATAGTTILAPVQGEPLPVKQTAKSSGQLGAGVLTMSAWGEPVHVSAPANTVSIIKVIGL